MPPPRLNIARLLSELFNTATYCNRSRPFIRWRAFDSSYVYSKHIARNVITLSEYIIGNTEYNTNSDADMRSRFQKVLENFDMMLFECAKMLAKDAATKQDGDDNNKRTVVFLILSHICLRYIQGALKMIKTYTFPGTLSDEEESRGFTGGALVIPVLDLVPQVPDRGDAAWALGSLKSLFLYVESGGVGHISFAKLPNDTTLSVDLEGHEYTQVIIEACLINVGKGSVDMKLMEGYEWDKHTVIDGVRYI